MPITNLQLITVTGKYLKLDGTAASGTVSFVPSTVIVNQVANEIVYPVPFVATLNGSGTFSIQLPATNDPDLTPSGWTYKVTEAIAGVLTSRTYLIQLPYDLAGATVDLADIAPLTEVPELTVIQVGGGETPWVVDISSWAGAPAASIGSWDYQENWPYYGGGLITNEVTQAQNDFIGYDVLLGAGTWTLEMLYRTFTSCGIVTIDLDGVVLGTFDMYGPLTPNIRGIITGIVVASSGKKRLSFRLLTKNVAAAAYLMYFIHAQLRRTA